MNGNEPKYTRKWYQQTLIAVFEGRKDLSRHQWLALQRLAAARGWNAKRTISRPRVPKGPAPGITEDLMERMSPNVENNELVNHANRVAARSRDETL